MINHATSSHWCGAIFKGEQMEVKHTNLYKRNGIIYIDATLTEIGRVRFSTKLKDTKENMAKTLLSAKDLVSK